MKFLILALLSLSLAFAHDNNDQTHRPASFAYQGASAVFVDFEEAVYDITYDITAKSAVVVAKIKLNVVESGYPIFDLVVEPSSVKINGGTTMTSVISTPANETKVRVINIMLPKGSYDLEVRAPITSLVEYTKTGVKSAF